jgi:citrate lyase subunit beta / citryl-CoA lyase
VSRVTDPARAGLEHRAAVRDRPYKTWPRTWLFAPADQERKLEAAMRSAAGAVVADLEDAVAPTGKALARAGAGRLAERDDAAAPWRVVRINEVSTPDGQDDLRWLTRCEPDAVMVPKATCAGVERTLEVTPRVVALVETALGVREAGEIADLRGVVALALGGIDLAAELDLAELPGGDELLFVRSKLVLDAAASGGVPVIDRVFPYLDDEPGLAADSARGRALGMRGKLCIHPRQLGTVEGAFAPSPDQLARATRIVERYEKTIAEGRGAVTVDGEMVDLATVRQAKRVLGVAPTGNDR